MPLPPTSPTSPKQKSQEKTTDQPNASSCDTQQSSFSTRAIWPVFGVQTDCWWKQRKRLDGCTIGSWHVGNDKNPRLLLWPGCYTYPFNTTMLWTSWPLGMWEFQFGSPVGDWAWEIWPDWWLGMWEFRSCHPVRCWACKMPCKNKTIQQNMTN